MRKRSQLTARLAWLAAATLIAAAPARADDPQLFADANTAFLQGDLARASSSYEALLAEGVLAPELETNLAGVYLRQGKRGLAALHLERALVLDPGDEDARFDLAELRHGNVDQVEGSAEETGADALVRALAPLPGTLAAVLLLVSWSLAWVFLALRWLRPSRWAGAGALAAFSVALLAAMVSWGAAAGRALQLRRAVVVAPAVAAREGPTERAASHFEVHEGTSASVEDEESGWRRVKLGNGLTGWIPTASIELVVPPGWNRGPSPRAEGFLKGS